MQNAIEENYNTEETMVLQETKKLRSREMPPLTSVDLKNLAFVAVWFLFLMAWINWSIENDLLFFRETMPAFIIITFIVMLKAMDRKI